MTLSTSHFFRHIITYISKNCHSCWLCWHLPLVFVIYARSSGSELLSFQLDCCYYDFWSAHFQLCSQLSFTVFLQFIYFNSQSWCFAGNHLLAGQFRYSREQPKNSFLAQIRPSLSLSSPLSWLMARNKNPNEAVSQRTLTVFI